ncbi:MAG TPA: endopeptidase La [Elusimicrobia bacterium]|nr:endopeptidase La [Elusimicrobiota bacterium]HBT61760.1 endopeptidase La [Elusimicrobiota bacterium]
MSPAPDFKRPIHLPLLAVRDLVVFPHMVLPLSVGRAKSVKALEAAMSESAKLLAVVAQKDVQIEDPQAKDVFQVGVLAEVVQYLKMPDGTLKVFLQGLSRISLARLEYSDKRGFWEADVEYPEVPEKPGPELAALMRHALETVEEHFKLSRRGGADALGVFARNEDPSQFADAVAAHAVVKNSDRQALLEILRPSERLLKLLELLKADIEILTLERKIHTRVKSQIEKTQKEYYLTEQMKAIQKELRQKDDFGQEIEELRKSIQDASMPKPALEASLKEVARLEKMMPYSPEATVARTYLDWMIHLPWAKRTRDSLDIGGASAILDADHYDLKKIKDRILEHLAVCRLTKALRGPILCFVGPPGVGKTSIGRSIARCMNRKFVRLSLGGVRDEAEIRGHRRTYIGSLPGRIIQSLRKAGTKNPLFLLDEVDKMGMDWRGDPAAALLEVLDPEQNAAFVDHYLDAEFDLSEVMFICTANTLEGIPVSLQDRLEILRFSGYTYKEKLLIARTYLLPKQLKEHGLKRGQVAVTDAAIGRAIDEYTYEAGVRNLDREMASLARKAAKAFASGEKGPIRIDADNLHDFLGVAKFHHEKRTYNALGVATGLAWTEVGGVTMAVEAVAVPGKGELKLTGKLGQVMAESAQAGFSYVKSLASFLGVEPEAFKDMDYHVHVPEGATPKDGPSAGIAIATALASLISGRPVLPQIAMTGEITLRGRILPIGGLKEKTLAAHRDGIKTMLYPDGNQKDLEDIPEDVIRELKMIPVKHFEEVVALALGPIGEAASAKPSPAGGRHWMHAGQPSIAPSTGGHS